MIGMNDDQVLLASVRKPARSSYETAHEVGHGLLS